MYRWEEAVYVGTHPASAGHHSYCVYSPCAEVSDDHSRLCTNSLSKCYGLLLDIYMYRAYFMQCMSMEQQIKFCLPWLISYSIALVDLTMPCYSESLRIGHVHSSAVHTHKHTKRAIPPCFFSVNIVPSVSSYNIIQTFTS